jgi:hypothetical protein
MNRRLPRAHRERLPTAADRRGNRCASTPVAPGCQDDPRGRRPELIAAKSFSEIEVDLGHLGFSASAPTNPEGG